LKTDISDSERRLLYYLICTINRRHYTTHIFGFSLLHLCLNEWTWADDSRFDYMHKCVSTHKDILEIYYSFCFRYPCLYTSRLLLQCGADINAIDVDRNTPLHILVSNSNNYDEAILQVLCDADAHLGYTNKSGKTVIDVALNPNIKQLLKTRVTLSLKCLCARLIRTTSVSFHGKIGNSLATFVERH
jgi:Fem-1 family protein b